MEAAETSPAAATNYIIHNNLLGCCIIKYLGPTSVIFFSADFLRPLTRHPAHFHTGSLLYCKSSHKHIIGIDLCVGSRLSRSKLKLGGVPRDFQILSCSLLTRSGDYGRFVWRLGKLISVSCIEFFILHLNNMSPAWSWQNYIPIFLLLVIMVILLASFVGSWFGITFGSGLKKAVSVRGSLWDGDKVIRR